MFHPYRDSVCRVLAVLKNVSVKIVKIDTSIESIIVKMTNLCSYYESCLQIFDQNYEFMQFSLLCFN